MQYKISLAVPCFERPARTLRAIEAVMSQDMNGWEAYFAGDNCPFIQELVDSGVANTLIDKAKEKGNKLAIFNLPYHYGGWGYTARNTIFKLSYSEYTMFMDNDDVILPNHFSNYYSEIVGTDYDMVYFNTFLAPIEPSGKIRESQLEFGMVGHQEVIIKSSLLSRYAQSDKWGHDWEMIKHLLDNGAKVKKSQNNPTYHIMSVGELRETQID
jgi:glycosyltransferase involved in cell wall biosynthesis